MISRKKLLRWLNKELGFYARGFKRGEFDTRADDRSKLLEFIIGKVRRMKKVNR